MLRFTSRLLLVVLLGRTRAPLVCIHSPEQTSASGIGRGLLQMGCASSGVAFSRDAGANLTLQQPLSFTDSVDAELLTTGSSSSILLTGDTGRLVFLDSNEECTLSSGIAIRKPVGQAVRAPQRTRTHAHTN